MAKFKVSHVTGGEWVREEVEASFVRDTGERWIDFMKFVAAEEADQLVLRLPAADVRRIEQLDED